MLKNRDEAFTGPLAAHFYGIVEERHRMGFKFGEEERLLHELDRMSVEFDCQEGLPEELVRKFIKRKPNWHEGTQEHHVQAIRIFALYLLRHDIPAFLVDYTSVTDLHEDYKPYIFTHEEINRIFEHADRIRANGQQSHVFYPVLFRVQYACGLRISETLDLKMSARFLLGIPSENTLHGTLQRSIRHWADDYFFMSRWGDRHYSINTVSSYFRGILFRCGIHHGGRKNGGPHLHCLRHTFCCHSLEKMLREGTAHQAALPFLMTYLGHSSLSATGYYLRLTAEAFPDLQDKINRLYGGVIPDLKVRLDYEDD